jgi:hypothetical protein
MHASYGIWRSDMDGIQVTFTGPMFNGAAEVAYNDFIDNLHREAAKVAQDMVGRRLIQVIREPTGFYESNIQTERIEATASRVHDNNVIYGNWLEGTSSRNRGRPGFPGYHTFRVVTQQMDSKTKQVADQILPKYLRRMN